MLQEFKEFINRGNVIDLAVAVVLGAAFAPVVSSVVDRVLMPFIGLLFSQPNFDTIGTFACDPDLDQQAGITVGDTICSGSIGAVLTALVNFLLVAFAIFLVVKAYNRLQRPEPDDPEPEADPEELVVLREIRDSLRTPGPGLPPSSP